MDTIPQGGYPLQTFNPRGHTLRDARPDLQHAGARQPGSDPYGHLPAGSFQGTIHLVDSEAKALRAALTLRRERTLGLDTESRPSFRRGELYPISLVQIATHRHAFLFRVRVGAPFRALKRIIENPSVRKIVQGASEESRELRRDLGIEAKGFVDLPTVAKAAGFAELNLRALAASALGIRISKAAQRSDWSRPDLSEAQLAYAATDAWACLAVHEKIESRAPAGRPAPKGELQVREATAADATVMVDLLRELAESIGERTPVDARTVRAWLERPGCGALIAERDGREVGMLSSSVRPNLYHGRDRCLVEELVVDAAARGAGVGKALLEAAIRDAARRGCAEISVSTSADNGPALALYRSAGLTDEALLLERHFSGGGGRSRRGRWRGRR